MTLFDRILLWRYRAKVLSRRELVVLRRTMKAYSHAYEQGLPLPELPRPMLRKLRTLWIWSAHRLMVEQPLAFVWGGIFAFPAIGVISYKLVMRLVHLAEMAL
ncbi:MAG: hypothetical protein Q7K57_06830 [Burkholderiaceae bacterium]|nr:hypothetical protein [Burkholderiaceae bacterium]